MHHIDDDLLIIIFSFADDYELQLMRLVCQRFDAVINSFDSIFARYLTGIDVKDPFWWLSTICYSKRGSLLKWIINDLSKLRKLKPSYIFHYPLQFDAIDWYKKILGCSRQTIDDYGESLCDPNLKPFSDFLDSSLNNERGIYTKQHEEIKSLRWDIVFANGVKKLQPNFESDVLEKLAKVGTKDQFDQWDNYFRNQKDWHLCMDQYFYTDNVEFFKFIIKLGKLGYIKIATVLEYKNFQVLDYLMDNFKNIEECGIRKCFTVVDTISALSNYRGKRGKELYCWMKSTYYVSIGYCMLEIFLKYNNLELLQLIMKDYVDQIDYKNFSGSRSYSFYINSAKVYHYLSNNFNYAYQGTHSCIISIKLLIYLLKNGHKFPSEITYNGDYFPKENMIKLLKQPQSIIVDYFRLIIKNHQSSQSHLIIKKYLLTLLFNVKNYELREHQLIKLCRCIIQSDCNLAHIFSDDIISKIVDLRWFSALMHLHKNNGCNLDQHYRSSTNNNHSFQLFAKKFILNQ